LNILQLSTCDVLGGAEKVAWDLFQAYRERGHTSWLAVGRKRLDDPDVYEIRRSPSRALAARFGRTLNTGSARHGNLVPSARQPRPWLRAMAGGAGSVMAWTLGFEDFNYPGSWRVLELPSARPDIVHAHNLHGGYFDLRFLPHLSHQAPVILTLQDAWLLSGHCAHSFDCERWRTGCGNCPDLNTYPAVRRDATHHNWQQKQQIYGSSRVYVAAASHWMMKKVEQSMLAPAIVESRVIPYAVDLSIYRPADRDSARATLGISPDARVMLFSAVGIRQNPYKDYRTLRSAIALVADRLNEHSLLLLALGEDAAPEHVGRAEVRFIPFQKDPRMVARYYQAADIYVHAAHAETWGLTITEALACGAPVVATAVGGIPEQIKGLRIADCGPQIADLNGYGQDEATGMLVAGGDAEGMARCIERLLADEALRRQLGQNAARDARQRFDLNRHADDYLGWYREILAAHTEKRSC
jgi:glycosyltransferase involved in cell wall biosynthesis